MHVNMRSKSITQRHTPIPGFPTIGQPRNSRDAAQFPREKSLNKLTVSPTISSLLKYSVLPTLKLSRQVRDRGVKALLYRNLFRNANERNADLVSERLITVCRSLWPEAVGTFQYVSDRV